MAAYPAMGSGMPLDELQALSKVVYQTLLDNDGVESGTVYHQADILEYEVIPERKVTVLLDVTNILVHDRLFKPVNSQGELGWVLRSQFEAKQYVIPLILNC